MSAIKLINSYPFADVAEFVVHQGINRIGNIKVVQGGEASIPTKINNISDTEQTLTIHATVNGFESEKVKTDDLNATIMLVSTDEKVLKLEVYY